MSDMALHQDHMTLAEYEDFLAGQDDDSRWELIGGKLFMMTNPTENHGQIAMNLAAPLKAAMDKAGCRTYAGSMRVQESDSRVAGNAAIPDVVVHCGPSQNRTFVTDPIAVVEVLSRSTMLHDRGVKFDFYRGLPSLQHIVLVYQGQMRIEHYRRAEEGWVLVVLSAPSDRLVLDALSFEIVLDTVYFGVPVLRPVEGPGLGDGEPPTLIS